MYCKSAPSLARLTTLNMGGTARVLLEPATLQGLERLPELLLREGGTPFVLGRGSNILARDGELPYALIRWQGEDTLVAEPVRQGEDTLVAEPVRQGEDTLVAEPVKPRLRIRASANIPLPRLVAFGAGLGCTSLAGLAGIPGQVGGAVSMNAGSYDVEFARLVRTMTVFTPERGVETLGTEDFTPRYRHTTFDAPAAWRLVLDVTLELEIESRQVALKTVGEHIRRKAATQPVRAASAGCVFRNPEGHSAGKLLDACGFRGKQLGGVAFSAMHANFLVNLGNGTATEALELLASARESVLQNYGIRLEPEVKFLPGTADGCLPC